MKSLTTRTIASTIAGAALLLGANAASASPTISVDMDPSMPGIQSSLSVGLGSTFAVDVVIEDNGLITSPTVFDTVVLELSFNNFGSVLGLGATGPLAGALAGLLSTIDGIGFFAPVVPGSALVSGASAPAAGFNDGSGALVLAVSPFVIFPPFAYSIGPVGPISILTIDFLASAVGVSGISAGGAPFGSPALSLLFAPVATAFSSGLVTVTAPVPNVPEPASLALLGLGLFGFSKTRRQKACLPRVA